MGQTKFSANLGFLWTELSLPAAIRAAAAAGFDAVECHWPYDTPPADVVGALREAGLSMLGLNTHRGDPSKGDFGLAALPDRVAEARVAIDEALGYARAVNAKYVHVMAGKAEGSGAQETYCANLAYACQAAPDGVTILIEPLNRFDAPGYYLQNNAQAVSIMDEVGADNLKLMFDCYHVQRTEGDLASELARLLPRIGHIQFASVPDRGPPGSDLQSVFKLISELGYDAPLGAEYNPNGPTEGSLAWLERFNPGASTAPRCDCPCDTATDCQ